MSPSWARVLILCTYPLAARGACVQRGFAQLGSSSVTCGRAALVRAHIGQSGANRADLYAVLELRPDATAQEVKRAYRRLALRKHPDINNSPDARAEFELLSTAYRTLIDQEQRRAYDSRQARSGGGSARRSWSARTAPPSGAGAPSSDPAAARAARAEREARARAADGPFPEDLNDDFSSLFGDVLRGVGKFVAGLDERAGLEDWDWLSCVETSASRQSAASWAEEDDAILASADEDTLLAELDDLGFLASQLEERRLRLQSEVSRTEALAVELLSRARDAESAARRAAATERAVSARQEAAAVRKQCEALLAHLYRVNDRKARLDARLAVLRAARPRGATSSKSGGAASAGSSQAAADFARKVEEDMRRLKEELRRAGKS